MGCRPRGVTSTTKLLIYCEDKPTAVALFRAASGYTSASDSSLPSKRAITYSTFSTCPCFASNRGASHTNQQKNKPRMEERIRKAIGKHHWRELT